jgi:hypothetical protein
MDTATATRTTTIATGITITTDTSR